MQKFKDMDQNTVAYDWNNQVLHVFCESDSSTVLCILYYILHLLKLDT